MLFRDGTANLTADMATVYKDFGAPTDGKLEVRIVVPTLAEASDTIVPTLHLSADGSGAGERTFVGDTITYAQVVTNKQTQFFMSIPKSPYQYVGLALDVTDADDGGDFNAGYVLAGVVPAGQYQDV
jgi:hypothetical protein